MKLTAMALAFAFALSSTGALAHTVRHRPHVRTHQVHRDAASSVAAHPTFGNPNGSGYQSRDVWARSGAYYGPMIPAGGGGR